MLIYKARQLLVLTVHVRKVYVFMVFTVLGLPCGCSLVSTLPHLVRKIHSVAGHHLRSQLGGVTSGLLCCAALGLTMSQSISVTSGEKTETRVPGPR